ncbi:MAG: DUF805 domain-containing protein [Bacteroidales bacterium]|nr:DUF805 domain-containing protein [Bacteroidales bacterium]
MKWYIKVLKNYATFSGRARRKEFWMFILFNFIFCVAAMILDSLLGLSFNQNFGGMKINMHYGWIYTIYAFAVFLPSLAVWVRRLHDIGKSGLLILLGFVPLVGPIILLVWACREGMEGENEYGVDTKTEGNFVK